MLVDYQTLLQHPEVTKRLVVELVCQSAELDMAVVVTVVNAKPEALLVETQTTLKTMAFPYDVLAVNPLGANYDSLTFKTMFAAKMTEHEVIFVVDSDQEALAMWGDYGVIHTFSGKTDVQA